MVFYGNELSKADILVALQNNAVAKDGVEAKNISKKDAEKLLKNTTYFYDLGGKILNVDLSSDNEFNEIGYDEINGKNSAFNCVHIAMTEYYKLKKLKASSKKFKKKHMLNKAMKIDNESKEERKRFQEFFINER